eukprot:2282242-Heterocapsa_arctica.AAC.1
MVGQLRAQTSRKLSRVPGFPPRSLLMLWLESKNSTCDSPIWTSARSSGPTGFDASRKYTNSSARSLKASC